MRPETWLEDVFSSRANVRVLRAMCSEPPREWTARELARKTGMSPNTASLAVGRLMGAGVLTRRRIGGLWAVRLLERGIVDVVRGVFEEERRTWARLEDAIREAAPRGVAVHLFGSTVRGEARRDSDIDLLVVAETPEAAEDAAYLIGEATWRVAPAPFSTLIYDRASLFRIRNKPFLRNALREGRPLSATRLEEFLSERPKVRGRSKSPATKRAPTGGRRAASSAPRDSRRSTRSGTPRSRAR